MSSLNVVILAYPGLCTFEFGIAVELFALDRPEEPRWYCTQIAAELPGCLHVSPGLSVTVDQGLEAVDRLREGDLVMVPGWTADDRRMSARLLTALTSAHERGVRMASICSGAFAMAEAGLLAGRRATTHWRYSEVFKQRFPDTELVRNILYTEDDGVFTSAGSSAGLDLGLHIIASDFGYAAANRVAKRLVLPRHRAGDQRQYAMRAPMASASALSPLVKLIEDALDTDWTVSKMATAAGMSERTLARRFADEFDCTPMAWLRRTRVMKACELLEDTSETILQIGALSGFSSEQVFRLHFKKELGLPPSHYRANFAAKEVG